MPRLFSFAMDLSSWEARETSDNCKIKNYLAHSGIRSQCLLRWRPRPFEPSQGTVVQTMINGNVSSKLISLWFASVYGAASSIMWCCLFFLKPHRCWTSSRLVINYMWCCLFFLKPYWCWTSSRLVINYMWCCLFFLKPHWCWTSRWLVINYMWCCLSFLQPYWRWTSNRLNDDFGSLRFC